MAPACRIPIHVLDMDAATDPVILAVSDYWCSLNDGNVPRRKAFDFMALYKSAPHMLMAERIAPNTFRFVYCGTALAENFPRDLTGLTFAPDTLRVSSIKFANYFAEVLDTPCWRFARERLDWPNAEYSDALYGSCPLADDNGQPAYVLSCLMFLEKSPYAPRT